MNLKLRRVSMESVSIIQEILDAAPRYTLNTEGVASEPTGGHDTLTALPPDCAPERKHVLIVSNGSEEEEAIGVVDLIQGFPDPETAFIGLFLLKETHQARGAGRAVYSLVEHYALSEFGAKRLRLAVVDSNPVQPFWEKMGFHLTDVVRPHEGRNLKSVKRVMEKMLGDSGA